MPALFWVFEAAVAGSILAYLFAGIRDLKPRWAAILLSIGAGSAWGIGVSSCFFFVGRMVIGDAPVLMQGLEVAAVVIAIVIDLRSRQKPEVRSEDRISKLNLILAGTLVVVLSIGIAAMARPWNANPHGSWDGWEDWNMRARFFAAPGDLFRRAWSPLIPTHAEYPLLIPAFLARCWRYGNETPQSVPIATDYLLFLAAVCAGTGGIAALRSQSLGLLFGLSLASTPFFLFQVPWLYADTSVAAYALTAVILLLSGRFAMAGALASLAAWTKHEGALFLAVILAVILGFYTRRLWKVVAGAAPVGVLLLFHKLVLVRGVDSLLTDSSSTLLHQLSDPGRYTTVLTAMVLEFLNMMSGSWYHPLLPLIALMIALRLRTDSRREIWIVASALAGMFAGYVVVLVGTPGGPSQLDWFVKYSLSRLFAQVWPVMLLLGFVSLRAPEEVGANPEESSPHMREETRTTARAFSQGS